MHDIYICVSPQYQTRPENTLPSVLLRVWSTSNNANGKKRVIFSSGIAWYYGDNDFIIRTFDFIACLDTCM